MNYVLAIDIGASSGRHIVGWPEGDAIRTEEVYRFPNGVTEQNGHLTWNIDALLSHVKRALTKPLKNTLRSKACPLTPGRLTMC